MNMKNNTRKIGIIMNGVTGRMGKNQHLLRSVKAIMDEGGIPCRGEIIMPDPVLLGRNRGKLEELVEESGIGREGSRYGIDDYIEIKYLCMGGL